ncbi:shikimate dehydrogenase family protein [Lapidilactobacillus achengensis]|uniref:Shikimate dehydrogenase (NADP(+)) n=1 Tax=Lapidilactobacillus achengensis TaxID=2486000 RepID=A0ABW1UQ91_9LACO|nr:shikimate dehydrogenase [Lapidilactobacillus achengensis]
MPNKPAESKAMAGAANAGLAAKPLAMPIDAATQVYGLLAHPAHHSLSPWLHNQGFAARQLNAVYLAFDSGNHSGAALATSIRALNLSGCNLSLPDKETILPDLDVLTPTAQLIGAVNTVTNSAGQLVGTNTDGIGFVRGLQAAGITTTSSRIVLLGGGAAARAILVALVQAGVAQLQVFQRQQRPHFRQLQELVAELGAATVAVMDWAQLDQVAWSQVDLVINATDLGFGAHQNQSPLALANLRQLPATASVWDVIYSPRQTKLLAQAAACGLATHNGLAMLLYQADAAFQTWTGQELPLTQLRDYLKIK